jgi:AbiTii
VEPWFLFGACETCYTITCQCFPTLIVLTPEMGSAVQNLQMAIVEGKQSLTQLLRQTKLIAAKLNLADVEEWVDLELNGYPDGKIRPEYRAVTTDKLLLHNPYRGWQYVGDVKQTIRTHQPIAEIEILAQEEQVSFTPEKNYPITDGLGTSTGSNWPQRVIVNPTQFKGILEAVRNELLRWAIELEKRGIKGEDMSFNEKEKQSATNQVFHIQKFTGILGNVQNSQVTLYDYSSVQQLLIDKEIPKQDRRELEDIMDELKEAPPEKKPSLIARGEQWIIKHKELLGAAAEAVGKALGAAIPKSDG